MRLKVTILGCGSSGGVPRIGGHWGACDPQNPKNRRRRCSLLVQDSTSHGDTNLLVDTTPDLRSQLLDAEIGWLDGVLYTHEHADHIHGIDELRVVAFNGRSRVKVYMTKQTGRTLHNRFGYCFETPTGSEYPPILESLELKPYEPVKIEGAGNDIVAIPFLQHHGSIESLGFRFGNLAYSNDLVDMPERSIDYLQDLDIWIVDALRYKPHPTHFSVDEALQWIERIKPGRAILTNMHIDLDYETLMNELPDNVEPAYDGMVLDVES